MPTVRRVTLKEVAEQAGVSYQTVSKVLNKQVQVTEETEQRILDAVRSLGYRPNLIARSMREQRTRLIGYAWQPSQPGLANPILDQFLQSMAQEAEAAGYHLMCFPHHTGNDLLAGYRDLIETNRVDAFVVSSVEFNDPRIEYLVQKNFPFVAFGRSNPDWEFHYVDVDGEAGMHMLIEHLSALGHEHIAALAWPETSRVGENRMAGFIAALKDCCQKIRPEWIMRGEGTFEFGQQAATFLLNQPAMKRPTALVAFNDIMAIGAMRAAQDLGLTVGREISITGFDDVPLVQYLIPPLTTIRQPIWEVGQNVINMLLSIMQGIQSVEKHVLLPPRLIVRNSTGRLL